MSATTELLHKIYGLLSISVDRTNMSVKTSQGITKPDALSTGFRITTMDYGDKTTWYQNSIQKTGEVVTVNEEESDAANNNYVIDLPGGIIIDIYSPRLSAPRKYLRTYEDAMYIGGLLMGDGSFKRHDEFEVKLFKDGIDITSHIKSIDYMASKVHLEGVDIINDNVLTANYWHLPESNASQFILKPHGSVKWFMKHVEMQLSTSVTYMPTIIFEMWAVDDTFDGDYNSAANRAACIGYEMHYRSGIDYINVGNEGKGSIPAHYNLTSPLIVFPFNYDRALDVGLTQSGKTKLIRIYSEDDRIYENTEVCTTSFYIEQTRLTL